MTPAQWFTIKQAAVACFRTEKTIGNLVSRHQLPRRIGWIVKGRLRRRRVLLSPEVVRYLQRITLEGEKPQSVLKPLH